MRRSYDDYLYLLDPDLGNPREVFWRIVQATAPDKFWRPRVDVYETNDAVKVKVELAGVRRDEIGVELSADGRSISIRGLRMDTAPDANQRTVYHQLEVYTGPFERTLQLPAGANVDRESVEAIYHDGFLLITLPKRAPRPNRTRIRVQE